MHRGLLLLALLVVGCGGTTASAPLPTTQPTATEGGLRDDAEQERLIREGIEIVYGEDPQPDWYDDLHIVGGEIDLAVDGTSLFVGATSAVDADGMCRDIATVAYDDNAEPIGFRHVHIQVGPDIVADCDTRE